MWRFIRINRRSLNYWTNLGDNSIRPIGHLGQLFWLEYIKAARLLLLCRSFFLLLRNIACLRLVVYWPFYLQVDLSTSSFDMILYLLEAVEVTRDRNSRRSYRVQVLHPLYSVDNEIGSGFFFSFLRQLPLRWLRLIILTNPNEDS